MRIAVQPAATPAHDVEEIPALVERLRDRFESGYTRPLLWRREQLEALQALLRERGQELVRALQADLGKPTLEAWAADVSSVKMEAANALKHLKAWTRPEKVPTPASMRPARSRIVREPLGVVLIIAPWNYPVQLLLSPLVGAIAAGNAAVLKPSEVTAHTSAALGRFIPEYLDANAIQVVEGGVAETTALLQQRFDHIFYTGNGRVAKVVMEAAAKHLTPVTLELGGKSPCLVDAEADVEMAARRICWGKFLNAGQTCIAPDYVLVHRDQEEPLLEALAKTVRSFYGESPQETDDLARIAADRHHARLAGLLKDGDVVVGGQVDAEDRFIAPTVLRNVDPEAPIMQEEIFGPILPVLPVDTMRDAIDFVNRRPKPLALYVFTDDPRTEERVVRETSAGGTCVNGTLWQLANPDLPFGGVGPSGMGAYHGRHTFETFSHRKAVVTKGRRFEPKMMYPPYGKLMTRLAKRFL